MFGFMSGWIYEEGFHLLRSVYLGYVDVLYTEYTTEHLILRKMPKLNRNLGQLLCTLGLVLPGTSLVYPRDNTSTKDGTFLQPAPISRPVFRYWLPDASVDADIVSGDVDAAAHVGAGGVEFLPFFEYGGQIGGMPAGANWSTYDFGTVPFRNLLSAALDAHEKNGLRMDVPLGPNQGQGVPAHPDDEGLQWDLVSSI